METTMAGNRATDKWQQHVFLKKKVLSEGDQHCCPPFKKVLWAIPEIINLGGASL